MNKLLTWDNLQKRGWIGPSISMLWKNGTGIVQHLFFHCILWKVVIDNILDQNHVTITFQSEDLGSYLEKWIDCFSNNTALYHIPFLAMWVVWKVRNTTLFEGNLAPIANVLHQIFYYSQTYCPPVIKRKKSRTIGLGPVIDYPCGYFDGALARGVGGAGYVLILSETHTLEFALGAGPCTNTKAELIGL